jgi:uncharacterized lipoprotein YbaY
MSTRANPLVSGEILFHPEMTSIADATVYVYLEDVSLQDASSVLIGKEIMTGVSHSRGTGSRMQFAIYAELPDERAHYSVRVHVSRDGREEIQLGDFVSTQSYPVITFGNTDFVSIAVQEVT